MVPLALNFPARYVATMREELRFAAPAAPAAMPPIVYTAMHGVGTPFVLQGSLDLRTGRGERKLPMGLITRRAMVWLGLRQPLRRTACRRPRWCRSSARRTRTFRRSSTPTPKRARARFSCPSPPQVRALHPLDVRSRRIADARRVPIQPVPMRRPDRVGAPLIIANDPDADRMATAERGADGRWRLFTGNEVGALLAWYLHDQWKQQQAAGTSQTPALLASAVSSRMLARMAKQLDPPAYFEVHRQREAGGTAAHRHSDGRNVVVHMLRAPGNADRLQVAGQPRPPARGQRPPRPPGL